MSDRDLLLSAQATTLPREKVSVPELGAGKVLWIQGMSGTDRDSYESSLLVQKGRRSSVNLQDVRAKLVVRCAIDGPPEGWKEGSAPWPAARLFRDEEFGQVSKIRGDVLGRLYSVAQRLSGLTDEDIDELGKSSETAPGTSSPSDLPGDSACPSA